MTAHWRILAPLLVIVAGICWHFGAGIISGVPSSELLQWEAVLDSVLRVRQVVLFPLNVVGGLAVWSFIGVIILLGFGIFLIGVPYMLYLRWREKKRWTEVSREAKNMKG